MIAFLTEPFTYDYMVTAMWVSALTGAVCGFLSSWLVLKGWSLTGDALSHSIVPGVAGAYMLGLPFSAGAFLTAGLAAAAMLLIRRITLLKEDTIIGMIFVSFFALGLFMISLSPVPINVQTIVLGNVLAIAPEDVRQLTAIAVITFAILLLVWRDMTLVFFDETHARAIGIRADALKALFFALLAAASVAAMQTVGALLVVAMVITPGATAYLLTDRFGIMIILSVLFGALTSFIGVWASFHLDGATGGIVIVLQTLLFLTAFFFAPKHGFLAQRRLAREGLQK